MTDILSFFSGTPRQCQIDALKEVEALWDSHSVFMLNLPVAAGKSKIAECIAKWSGNSAILVPNNMLLDQYVADSPELTTLRKRDTYKCERYQTDCQTAKYKFNCEYCDPRTCPYQRAVARAEATRTGLYNYHTYLAHRLYRPTVIVDEAHLLIPMLRDLATKKLWQRDYHWPNSIQTLGDVLRWVEGFTEEQVAKDKKLKKLKAELLALQPSTSILRDEDTWRGHHGQPVLKLIPLDVRNEPPLLWPPKTVKKLVLLSATIGKPDLEIMGLTKNRVAYIYGKSPIPVANRPCDFVPTGNMSYAHQDKAIPDIAKKLLELADRHPGEKGLVHAPYSVMAKLRRTELAEDPRFLWHDKEDKNSVYTEFRESDAEDGLILMASGMYEGVDLPYDAGRWQAILKIPYPSLADPAIRAMMERSAEWYGYETCKVVIQAYGRICRTPTDYGQTYILDSSFGRLLEQHRALFPPWFLEAQLDARAKLLLTTDDDDDTLDEEDL